MISARLRFIFFSLIFSTVFPVFADSTSIAISDSLTFSPPQVERLILRNGVVLHLMEDHERPFISLSIRMKTSPADEEAVQVGAAQFLGVVWRSGGTQRQTPQQLNRELETLAASISSSVTEEMATVGMNCFSKDIERVLELTFDVLLRPRFDPHELLLAKDQALESIRRKNDTPFEISRRAVRDVIYGKRHYYSRNLDEKQVRRIKRRDLQTLHRKITVPSQAVMSLSGDFDRNQMLVFFDQYLSSWTASHREVPPYDYSALEPSSGSVFIVNKDINQTRIVLAQQGPRRHDPDLIALEVANTILGGSGPSRLFGEIRSRLGLAYMVGSFYIDYKGPGMTGAVCQTKIDSTLPAIEAIIQECKKISTELVSERELKQAKDSLVNAFVFRFSSIDAIVRQQADLEVLGYPTDYLKTYTEKVKAITANDVLSVCQKYFSAKRMKIVVVGNQNAIRNSLDNLGPVVEIPLELLD